MKLIGKFLVYWLAAILGIVIAELSVDLFQWAAQHVDSGLLGMIAFSLVLAVVGMVFFDS